MEWSDANFFNTFLKIGNYLYFVACQQDHKIRFAQIKNNA
jgi:hypothetical protein